MTLKTLALVLLLAPWAGAPAHAGDDAAAVARQVHDREAAFAATMAARDHAAFVSFVADEAVFVGPNRVLRGVEAVAAGWRPFFEDPLPPFSWAPAQVEILESGRLALSSGPVLDPQGQPLGTFTSIWRREADGTWMIVFDKGCPACTCDSEE